jgi:predicted Zn-dependent peptidase
MCDRLHKDYHASDLLRDIFSTGDSSRLYNQLVKEQKLFSTVSAYVTESIDDGLFLVEGRLQEGVSMEQGNAAIVSVLQQMIEEKISEEELTKVKNKIESYMLFGEVNILNRAMNLAYFDMLGNAADLNDELAKYKAVTADDIQRVANQIFQSKQCNTIHYYSKK